MSALTATVLLPTTGNKGKIIGCAMESVLSQTMSALELFVVGDGAGEDTVETVDRYCSKDSRVRYFGFPKQTSRGTPNRHRLLKNEAGGRLVFYICDRDLWSLDHIECLSDALRDCDFAYSQSLRINRSNIEFGPPLIDLTRPDHRKFFLSGIRREQEFIPLSCAAHTMEMYARLPFGWCESPNIATDYHMWLQFLGVKNCRVGLSRRPTVLWLPRSEWGTDQSDKAEPLKRWWGRVSSTDWPRDRWQLAFEHLYTRGASFRVRAAIAEDALGMSEL